MQDEKNVNKDISNDKQLKLSYSKITITRFNSKTYQYNKLWRENNQFKGCIYGSPTEFSEKYTPNTPIFVIEMNNCLNIIEGIGLIINKKANEIDKRIRVYDDANYNRYTYMSEYRIDKSEFLLCHKLIINLLEIFLFKGSKHSKRSQGITLLPEWIKSKNKLKQNLNYKIKLLLNFNFDSNFIKNFINNKGYFDFNTFFQNLFIQKYKCNRIDDLVFSKTKII
tara:strand:- start:101 stop:772 length:672 start_codon:yes stop_codon:yes gene_type:complete